VRHAGRLNGARVFAIQRQTGHTRGYRIAERAVPLPFSQIANAASRFLVDPRLYEGVVCSPQLSTASIIPVAKGKSDCLPPGIHHVNVVQNLLAPLKVDSGGSFDA
jgi:hypothetical protein